MDVTCISAAFASPPPKNRPSLPRSFLRNPKSAADLGGGAAFLLRLSMRAPTLNFARGNWPWLCSLTTGGAAFACRV